MAPPLHATLLVSLALWLGPVSGCDGADSSERPPALVLVSIDTLRADRLGVHGYERDTSPVLDRWARGAVVFDRAHSLSNETVSSHHGLFQSKLPSRALRRPRKPTLAGILREAGFRTAGFTDGGPMSAAYGFDRGFERFDAENVGIAQSLPKALAWIDEMAGSGAPFYLFLHCFDVHLPYDPPPPWDTRFAPDYAGSVRGDRTRALLRRVRGIFEFRGERGFDLPAPDREKVSALYDGEIAKTDALLPPLLDRLDRPDLRDRTLVVILSDHGEEFWDHGSVLHAHTLYQELLHVPLMLRIPGTAGRRIGEPVSLIDVVPTLLDLLGVAAPEALRGRSLLPLVEGGEWAERPVLGQALSSSIPLQSVIVGSHKLIRRGRGESVELYDLETDPRERTDLADQRPALRRSLVAVLDRLELAADRPQPFEDADALDGATRERLRALGYLD